jgi:hypothetical protein
VLALLVLGVATAAAHRVRRAPATASPDVPTDECLVVACHDCAPAREPDFGERRLGATICTMRTSVETDAEPRRNDEERSAQGRSAGGS